VDIMDAVAAEVAAELRISQALAMSHLGYGRAMRERLPQLAVAFRAGDVDLRTFQTVVFRTDLLRDDEVMASVDAELAVAAPRWSAMSRGRVAAAIDAVVARVDRDAVRRRRDRMADREVLVGDVGDGLAELTATLFATDAHAVAERLTALAMTVCEGDPRTLAQRRADSMGAFAMGADRLSCGCGRPDCPAGGKTASAVQIHLIAEQATLDGTRTTPGVMTGYDGLIPPELIAELARFAQLRPVVHPGDAAPEPGYIPSRALAEFVRCRDQTCRAPGCDAPAGDCDIDHTIPPGCWRRDPCIEPQVSEGVARIGGVLPGDDGRVD
jgi:Domain of unknown function (DUF222)